MIARDAIAGDEDRPLGASGRHQHLDYSRYCEPAMIRPSRTTSLIS
jgi:hypothetical protein